MPKVFKTRKEKENKIRTKILNEFIIYIFKQIDKIQEQRVCEDEREKAIQDVIFKEMKKCIYTEAMIFTLEKEKVKVERI